MGNNCKNNCKCIDKNQLNTSVQNEDNLLKHLKNSP